MWGKNTLLIYTTTKTIAITHHCVCTNETDITVSSSQFVLLPSNKSTEPAVFIGPVWNRAVPIPVPSQVQNFQRLEEKLLSYRCVCVCERTLYASCSFPVSPTLGLFLTCVLLCCRSSPCSCSSSCSSGSMSSPQCGHCAVQAFPCNNLRLTPEGASPLLSSPTGLHPCWNCNIVIISIISVICSISICLCFLLFFFGGGGFHTYTSTQYPKH